MKIFIDFDDTIVDTVSAVVPILQEMMDEVGYNKKIDRGMITHWGIAEIFGIEDDMVRDAFHAVDYRSVRTFIGAPSVIWNLVNRGHNVTIVTANPMEHDIRAWLDKNGLWKIPLVSTPAKNLYIGRNEPDLVIDDNPDTAQFCDSMKIKCLLPSREWNSSAPALHHVYRFHSWSAVLPMLDDMDSMCTGGGVMENSLGDRWLDGDVAVNENGAKQTNIRARYDLLPSRAIAEVARVLHEGAEKYEANNWRGLSVDEIHNHTLGHAISFIGSRDLEDLSHAACRALMALEIYLDVQER